MQFPEQQLSYQYKKSQYGYLFFRDVDVLLYAHEVSVFHHIRPLFRSEGSVSIINNVLSQTGRNRKFPLNQTPKGTICRDLMVLGFSEAFVL